MMGYALYSQYVDGLDPCPLCIFQRVALVAVAVVFLAGVVYVARGWGKYIHALFFVLAAGAGVAVAGRHVYLQSLPPGEAPACSMMSLDFMLGSFPLLEVLQRVFTGSGECAEIDWQFLGLSMPAWVLIWFVILGVAGIFNTLRDDSR
ncbi:MAG: disulfide bond formation protein B [Gammaproteobacteria bacterium]|nr:disulfide bond formation protein B [Gammaproteobacteria bacterium]